jgi:hypothetical protein
MSKDRAVAYNAVDKIKKYWRTHGDPKLFEMVQVSVHPGTFAIKSNMVNGYPPLRGKTLEV